ncbi:hypothetical protein BV22DRAFT_1039541 [Leucogyrophana mollusca]|uniref:Uncharacterized protein n=1 Tax=Leucogyrophana mollusca TaxID=85980 RepID=A0ACB8B4J5_9AGAM|nr:hypothetical protein BV22DRAFT_1039541 [Leucogyrophana mollusca]
MSYPAPVLVAGAGPAGLVAALTLLQNGIPVRIIEKERKYRIGQRGAGNLPRSLELYNFLGVPEVDQVGKRIPLIRLYKPGTTEPIKTISMVPHTEPTPAIPFHTPKMIGQETLEGILRAHLEKLSCFVELGTELRSFEQFHDHVVAHLEKTDASGTVVSKTIEASWLIGADGAKGVVRKGLGLTFLGETREELRVVIGDIRLTAPGIDRVHWHRFGNRETRLLMLRPTDEVGENGFQFSLFGAEADPAQLVADHDALFEFISSVTGADVTIHEVVWANEFRPNIRMVNKFGEGRVFVAGDAAHVHSPSGGQGLNSSVQDTFNLCWKLALVQKDLAPPSLLDTYTAERLPVIAEMLELTTSILNQTLVAASEEEAIQQRGQRLLMLGINYRSSSIVRDEFVTEARPVAAYGLLDEGRLEAGDRAPDAPGLRAQDGTTTKLFDIYRPWYHTVLVFGPDAAQSLGKYDPSLVRLVVVLPASGAGTHSGYGADMVLVDEERYAHSAYLVKEGDAKVVVIRPDGVVGAIVHNLEGVNKYFGGIFSSIPVKAGDV